MAEKETPNCPTCGGAFSERHATQSGPSQGIGDPERVVCTKNSEHVFAVLGVDMTSGGQRLYRIIVPDDESAE